MKLLPAITLDKINTIKKEFPEILFMAAGFRKAACEKAGISRTSFYNWYNDDPEFRKAIDEVDQSLIDMAESQLLINIKKGKETSLIFFLKNKAPHRWRDVHELDIVPPEERIRKILEAVKNANQLPEHSPSSLQEPVAGTIPDHTGTE
jgi:hypothetical protein